MQSPPPNTPAPDTSGWYDDHARAFFEETVGIELPHAYEEFLPRLPAGGSILDAGCGSGRDSRRFRDMGFQVEAFDVSREMVRLAREHTGLRVRHLDFLNADFHPVHDGVFANASLLHVTPEDLPGVLRRLAAALKPAGVFFASFKHGQGEHLKDDQLYVCRRDEAAVRKAILHCGLLEAERLWTTADTRPGRAKEQWLHLLATRNALPIIS
ncbi:MAG: class I SAM-dependent methyltransferase [Proteobacteria bacterium]|nr:class I SAM-dependent methyltransferase [Pseudomonadota bacterium]